MVLIAASKLRSRRRDESDASLEVCLPLQRSLAAMRCPWLPCLRDDPAPAFSRLPMTRASTEHHRQSVAHAVLRSSDARRSCSMCEPIAACGFAGRREPRRTKHSEQPARKSAGLKVLRASEFGESESRARERPATSSITASPIRRLMPGHAPSRSLARCSATSAQSLRGLAGRLSPSLLALSSPLAPSSLVARRRSWGSCSARLQVTGLRPSPKLLFSSLRADAPALGLCLANWL